MQHVQRTLDFDALEQRATEHVAESTSRPPPSELPSPPLTRPDRQLTYGGIPHDEWPAQEHDRDAIAVDRIREDIDGPSHRFLIYRGDTVEVFFGKNRTDVGEVTGINHRNQEVRVSFHEGSDGVWVDSACVYPTAEELAFRGERGVPLSKVVARANVEPPEGYSKSDRVEPIVAAPTPQAILRFLISSRGREFSTIELRRRFGCVEFDQAHPLQNPVHLALQTLRDKGRIHVVDPRWGEPRISVLKLPDVADELTLADCPRSLSGPEVRRLFVKHRQVIADFAKKYGFTQKHVRDVLERGLENQNAVRDWLEAILPRRQSIKPHAPPTAAPDLSRQGSYTLEEYKTFRRSLAEGSLSFAEYQTHFDRILAAKQSLQTDLVYRSNAKQLATLALGLGVVDAKRNSKARNAQAVYHAMLRSFVLEGVISYSMTTTLEEAVIAKVRATTIRDFVEARRKVESERKQHDQALDDPRTFFEFRTFLREKSEADLNDEQLARYDSLHADFTREQRANSVPSTVAQFQSEELSGFEFQLKEGYHDKRHCPVWIVALTSRVERNTFKELNDKAKLLGGRCSSFKKSDTGFQFFRREQAERFTTLLNGDADRADLLAARKDRKEQTTAERLHELANALAIRADETIEQSHDSLHNTVRRADVQAGVRGRAYGDQALARTLHSIAEALSRGNARYLDGIRHKTHVETLDSVLSLAKWARVRAVRRIDGESSSAHGRRFDQLEEEPIGPSDVRFVEYPAPQIHKRHLDECVVRCRTAKGAKQAADKMAKRLAREQDDYVTFRQDHDVRALEDFVGRAKSVGVNVERIEPSLEKYQRLQRANLKDLHELRAALREYLTHRAAARGDDPVKIAERELIGKELPGFFPTPRPVIERMLELADIQPHHAVLEPSCGMGSILDALCEVCPEASVTAIERNLALADVLAAKGYDVVFADFLSHEGMYDRIVMNPPFERGQEIDHVRHAYALLAPGGRLVSVMSAGPFFRSDAKSRGFREWLDARDHDLKRLPEDAFRGIEAFHQMSVRTSLLTIIKEEHE